MISSSAIRACGSVLLFLATLSWVDTGAQAQVPRPVRPVERLLAPAPAVTSWTPPAKAYPGQALVILGSGFKPDAFRVALVTASGRVALPIRRSSTTRIEASITDEMYKGGPRSALCRQLVLVRK